MWKQNWVNRNKYLIFMTVFLHNFFTKIASDLLPELGIGLKFSLYNYNDSQKLVLTQCSFFPFCGKKSAHFQASKFFKSEIFKSFWGKDMFFVFVFFQIVFICPLLEKFHFGKNNAVLTTIQTSSLQQFKLLFLS